jgi:ParB/RepB/Spo0J family partition protein
MAKSRSKVALSASRDVPFNKLVLSQANVRHIKAGVAIEELADDIARRTLLQSLTVRPVVDNGGAESGTYEVPAGGRRYRALELLVKQKRLARTAPIPCIVRTDGIPEEDSLAENVQRAPLHPLDQFRAFLALREKGKSEEDNAAAFFVSGNVVQPAPAARRGVGQTARGLRRGRHDARPAHGLHRQPRPCAARASVGGAAALAHEGALPDPPNAHRRRRSCLGQAGAVRWHRGV